MADISEARFTDIYEQLRRIASRYRWDQDSLQPTAVVHEAYLKLRAEADWPDQIPFRAIAARAMRQVLLDRARRRHAAQRGGGWERVTLSGLAEDAVKVDAIDLDRALSRLQRRAPRKAAIVELHIFGGLSQREIAEQMELSLATIEKDWRSARAWLAATLRM